MVKLADDSVLDGAVPAGAFPVGSVLDDVFAALSDPTRRQVLEALGSGSQSVSTLAQAHGMSLPGFMKHLRVLESAGLIERMKEGRVVRCSLAAQPMQEAAVWLSRYEKFWTARLDALGRYLYHQQETNAWQSPPATPETPQTPQSARTPPTPIPGQASSSSGATTLPRNKSGTPGPTRKR